MASAPGFRKPLYGRFAPWADKYTYCGGDPISRSDPSGLQGEPDPNLDPSGYAKYQLGKASHDAKDWMYSEGDKFSRWVDHNWAEILLTIGTEGIGSFSRVARVSEATRALGKAAPVGERLVVYNRSGGRAVGHFARAAEASLKGERIAGAGSRVPIREAERLAHDYGGLSGMWQKKKGFVNLTTDAGVLKRAEVHWYEYESRRYEYRYIP